MRKVVNDFIICWDHVKEIKKGEEMYAPNKMYGIDGSLCVERHESMNVQE